MKLLRYFVVFLIVVIASLSFMGYDYLFGGVVETYFRGWKNSNIDDISFRELRTIAPSTAPDPWISKYEGQLSFTPEEDAWNEEMMTASFLVIHGDTLVFERYAQGHDEHTLTNSFSACKSIVALAIGLAHAQGLVSVDDEVSEFLPRFGGEGGRGLTVQELLQMRSTIPFGEDYNNPFGFMAKAYYRDRLQELVEPYRVEGDPGTEWMYQGGNTLLLGELIASLQQGNLSQWVERGLWEPMGAQDAAFWGLDAADEEGGIERCFAQFYATSRDFARFGKLINHQGNWNGRQLIDSAYMNQMVRPIREMTEECDAGHYGYQIWLGQTESGEHFSCMEGLRGQMIISVPTRDAVIVRTGYNKSEKKRGHIAEDIHWVLEAGLRLLEGNRE